MTLNLPFVMEFVVYLTHRCNLRCEMCSQYGDNFKEKACADLPFEKWQTFFDSISDVNPKPKIILMGGEPLLHKDFDTIVKYLNKHKFYIQIVTNGVLLDKHIKTLAKCKNITITISLDGLEKTHDKIRRVDGTFKKVLENIRKLSHYKKKNKNLFVYINSVLLPDNIDEINTFVKTLQKEDIDQFVFQHLQFASEKVNNISKQEWESCMSQTYGACFSTQKEYKIDEEYTNKLKNLIPHMSSVCKTDTFIFPYLTNDEIDKYYFEKDLKTIRPQMRCTTPWLTAFISAEGNVANCIENTIGNITKENFWDIWNNEKANKLRNILCKNGNFSICSKCCNFYKSCFIYAPNGKVKINGQEYILPDELNYMEQTADGVLILDKSRSTESELFAYPVGIHSQEMLEDIKKHETVLCHFREIGG